MCNCSRPIGFEQLPICVAIKDRPKHMLSRAYKSNQRLLIVMKVRGKVNADS